MKKFLAMALAAVMVLALAACGSKNDTADDTGDAQDAQGGETQKLIVGFDAEFPPFGFIAADGTYDGFDLAMAKELCARLGWEYEAVAIDWNSKDAELSSGTINCIWNGFTYTGRENDYTFSDPYVDNSIVMVVKADSGITSLADLAGKSVMAQAASSAVDAINERRLAELDAPSHTFEAEIEGAFPEYLYPTHPSLMLKKGAQVMFVKNDPSPEKRYYNGRIGTVTALDENRVEVLPRGESVPIAVEPAEWTNAKYVIDPDSKEISERIEGRFVQYPLRTAFAAQSSLTMCPSTPKAMSGWQSGSQRTMSSNKKRINLSFSMSSPIQRRAWKKLTEIPAGQRTAAVCRMVCEYKGQQELLDAVRQTIRQELRGVQLTKEEAQDSGRAGDVDESVLGFLLALQEGDEMT